MSATTRDPELDELLGERRVQKAIAAQTRDDAERAEALQKLHAVQRERDAQLPGRRARVDALTAAARSAEQDRFAAAAECEAAINRWRSQELGIMETLKRTLPAVLRSELSFYDQRITDERVRIMTRSSRAKHDAHVASLLDCREAVLRLVATDLADIPAELTRIRGSIAPRAAAVEPARSHADEMADGLRQYIRERFTSPTT